MIESGEEVCTDVGASCSGLVSVDRCADLNAGNPLAGAAVFGGYVADKFELGVNYALGPGIKLVGGGILWNVGGPVNGTQGQSWALMMGMDLRF